ncbi:hypothetical protein Ddye_029327 [Dipteronia dyeriana]|uniref:Uncharacterized protein n=1 Tax=Dipteronia dyeriana TaxID=168575 RepID=A0AAD9TE65_9ROSI|nr:hypothetical protein Ddye_029327 [Dipteronia dyeriana]
MGVSFFEVKMVEDAKPVDMGWLERFMGLRKNQYQTGQVTWLGNESFQTGQSIEDGRVMVYKETGGRGRKVDGTAKGSQMRLSKDSRGKGGEGEIRVIFN